MFRLSSDKLAGWILDQVTDRVLCSSAEHYIRAMCLYNRDNIRKA